jgi:hypothetical protein
MRVGSPLKCFTFQDATENALAMLCLPVSRRYGPGVIECQKRMRSQRSLCARLQKGRGGSKKNDPAGADYPIGRKEFQRLSYCRSWSSQIIILFSRFYSAVSPSTPLRTGFQRPAVSSIRFKVPSSRFQVFWLISGEFSNFELDPMPYALCSMLYASTNPQAEIQDPQSALRPPTFRRGKGTTD